MGCGPGDSPQPGRRQPGAHRSERRSPAAGDRRRAGLGWRAAVGSRLRGGSRHRHVGRRSDRGRSHRNGLPRRAGPGPAAAHRFGQDQRRPSGVGGRRGRADQGDAGHEARGHPQAPQLRGPEPGDRLGPAAAEGHRGAHALAQPRRRSPSGRGQRLRLVGHQRPRRGGRVRSRRGLNRGCRSGAMGLGGAGAGRHRRARGNPGSRGSGAHSPPGQAASTLGQDRRIGAGDGGGLAGVARGPLRRPGRRRCRQRAARRRGLDRRGGAEPHGPPVRRRLHRRRIAARVPAGRGRRRRPAAADNRDPGGLRLHRPGQPVGGHGTGALRMRAGLQGCPRPLRRGAPVPARGVVTRRDVRLRGGVGRPGLDTALHLRDRVRPDRAVVEHRRPPRCGRWPQPGRDRGRAGGRSVQPRGWPAVRGRPRRAYGLVAGGRRHGRGVRHPGVGCGRGGRVQRRDRRLTGERGRRQRDASGDQRPGRGGRRPAGRLRVGEGMGATAAQESRLPQRSGGARSGRPRGRGRRHRDSSSTGSLT